MDVGSRIEAFLKAPAFAVIGVSKDRAKYGNKVLRNYLQRGLEVHPVHPSAEEIEGVRCVRNLVDLPQHVRSLSIITPPPVTERVVEDAARTGVKHLWMQPGAESPHAVARAEELGLDVISGGPCLLVRLGFREE